ncbi:MAG: hypothetical protein QOI15_775 [Pseudonocardiales bacterium]|nr:hypothetical protein [Pseudonocardiales bacterium]
MTAGTARGFAGTVLAGVLACAGSAGAATPAYTAKPGPFRAAPAFTASYRGSGHWRTVFHATPPNPGGASDTNDADDASTQDWSISYRRPVVVTGCRASCPRLVSPLHARGTTRVTGRVRHKHVDGLYRQLDAAISCHIHHTIRPRTAISAKLHLRYSPDGRMIAITAENPVADALVILPHACPGQGDSIDRILDSYFEPGFSFSPAFGADRWLQSATVEVPVAVLQRSSEITIPLRNTRAATPPRGCAVKDPAYERCRTGGSWTGVLRLKATRG